MTIRHALLALIVVAIWGSNFVVIAEGLAEVPPTTFAALRFTLVAIPAIFFVKPPQLPWPKIVAIGLLTNFGQFFLIYAAIAIGTPPGLVGVVLQTQVLATLAFAALFLGERLPRKTVLAFAISGVGLALLTTFRADVTPLLGLVLTCGAALSWAAGNVVARTAGAAGGLSLVIWSGAAAAPGFVVCALLWDGPAASFSALATMTINGWLSTAYTVVISTLVGFGIWNHLMTRNPAYLVVRFALLIPAVALLCGYLVYRDVPTIVEFIGSALLVVGAAGTITTTPASPRPNSPADSRRRFR